MATMQLTINSDIHFVRLILHYINMIQQDATVCRYLFTAKSLYMFRVSIAPINQ